MYYNDDDNVLSAPNGGDILEKTTGIYVRRSKSDKDKSLSIESQKAECVKSLEKGENYKIYCDDGKSGKDIEHRPAFQQMMSDAKDGLISRIIVKKYDRACPVRQSARYTNVLSDIQRAGRVIARHPQLLS